MQFLFFASSSKDENRAVAEWFPYKQKRYATK